MKNSITALLILLLAVCGMAGAFAQSESDFICIVADGKVTITGYKGSVKSVVIPATMMGGLPVIAIRDFVFYNCTGVTSVNIPDGVTGIGGMAFTGCTNLSSVSIPDSVTSIGVAAFSGCASLTSVKIPASVTSIEGYAFSDCTGLTGISVDPRNASYTSRDGVLFNKKGDTLIAYPAGKKEQYAIPVSVTSIKYGAFRGCTGLTSVSIPASFTGIKYGAFRGCTGLTSVSIPASVTSIGDGAFWGCTSLTSISIPASVTSIGALAFSDCTNLTSISIGASVTFIGWAAFSGCAGLMSIYVDPRNTIFTSRDGVLFIKAEDEDILVKYPAGKKENQYVIPAGVTSIWDDAFMDCTRLTSIIIPDGVTEIGKYDFNDCDGLTSIRIGANVSLEDTFPNKLAAYYNTTGKKAGVYIYRNGAWGYVAQ